MPDRLWASQRPDEGQVGGPLWGDATRRPIGQLPAHARVCAWDAGRIPFLLLPWKWNDGYRAMVVGLAADCCAVGGVSVDGELLISFWWRTF